MWIAARPTAARRCTVPRLSSRCSRPACSKGKAGSMAGEVFLGGVATLILL
jgi:hypothetical protein